jgi:hypothetical protein
MPKAKASKLIVMATMAAGAIAAYLMHRKGESFFSIARKTIMNPVGSFASEVKDVVTKA